MMNIMLDLETLGTRPSSVILTIAAVKFEFASDQIETFSMNIDPKNSKTFGLTTDPDTVQWWKEQNPEALKAFMKDPVSLETAIDSFIEFVGPKTSKMVFWANGASFDYPILESSFRAVGRPYPWKYWNCRCARTIYSVFGLNMKEYPRVGVYHNAVDDCLTQIKALKECLTA